MIILKTAWQTMWGPKGSNLKCEWSKSRLIFEKSEALQCDTCRFFPWHLYSGGRSLWSEGLPVVTHGVTKTTAKCARTQDRLSARSYVVNLSRNYDATLHGLASCWLLPSGDDDLYTVSQKNVSVLFFSNNSVKHWPILIVFGVQHR